MRSVHGTAKDDKGKGVADCSVEALFEYRVAAAEAGLPPMRAAAQPSGGRPPTRDDREAPAEEPTESREETAHEEEAGYVATGRAVATTGVDGAFTMALPDAIESKSVRFTVSEPSGGTIGGAEVLKGKLDEDVEIIVGSIGQIVVDAVEDSPRHEPQKFVGRVFDTQGRKVPGGLQVVVYATAKQADAVGKAIPMLLTQTDPGGYFTGEQPATDLYLAYATVGSIPTPVDIEVEDKRLPTPLLLAIDLGDLVTVGDGADTTTDDCACGDAVPRTPDQWDLANSPGTFSTDLGTGCVQFNVPNRAIDEFDFYTVVRTTEPEIRGVTVGATDTGADQRQRVILRLIGQLRSRRTFGDDVLGPGYRSLLTELLDRLGWPDAQDTVDKLESTADLDHLLQLVMFQALSSQAELLAKPSSRTLLSPTSSVDWDSSPTFFEAASIAHGHILHFKQVWYADGYSLGDLLYSLPLAPGQKRVISIVDWERREQATRSEQTSVSESLSALLSRDRDLSEVVSGVLSESMRGGSTATTSGIGAGHGGAMSGSYQAYSFGAVHGVSGGYGEANSNAWQDSAKSAGAQSLQQLRDKTLQSASAVRGLRSTAVYTATQGEAVRASTEIVANHNHCHALTIQYFEVLRHLKLVQELADVQECLFVPMPMTVFDRPKALRWRESLQPYLRRPELAPAFDASRRVETKWAEVMTPSGRYADELVTAVVGELELTIIIPLPPIPPKPPEPLAPEKVVEALSPTTGFLGVLTAIATGGASLIAAEVTKTVTQGARATAESLYNEVGPEAVYERFQRDVMPGVAVGFVDELELWYRGVGNQLVRLTGVDFTLVSDYQPGRPLLVSVRGSVNNQAKRSDITQLVVKSAVGLPPGCRVILNTASLRYQTTSFEHPFVSDWRVNDDIELPKANVNVTSTEVSVTFNSVASAHGATLYAPIDVWEQKNPRKEDERLAGELVDHLNDGLEYYHNAIWWTMDSNRRYMLLDGFIAPRSGGRSVASVVENRLLGIAGNSLIMPVARGVHLDPRFKASKPGEMLDLTRYYAPTTPIPPARVSLPTRGVFAEAVMGSCNACEHMDDTRFWRWEEHPLEDLPALPGLESRRSEIASTTTPTALPTPVVSIQNAPTASEPQGLTQLLNLLGQQTFRDITGLAANQQNAAAAYKQALETASEFGKEASQLTQQAAMLKSLDKAMASIDKAEAEKKIKPEDAQKLRTSALEKVTGGTDGTLKASDVTERLNMVKKAVADGAIDETAAKGFSQSVLRSYVEGSEKPPTERAAAAKLIDEIPREAVTRVETGSPAEGSTVVETGDGGSAGGGGPRGFVADLVMGASAGVTLDPLLPFDPNVPSAEAVAAAQAMTTTPAAQQQQRRDDYVTRFGFDASAPEPIRGSAVREPARGILDSDLDAVLKVAETIGTKPEYVLAVWISEGKSVHNAMLHGGTENQPLGAKPSDFDARSLRAFSRSVLLFKAFGLDAFAAIVPRGGPDGDNRVLGPEGDHDQAFAAKLARMRVAGVGGMSSHTDREILDFFTVSGGAMRVINRATSIDIGLRDNSLASWLWLQAGLFELFRKDTEQQLFEMYGAGAVDLGNRPWVTYLRWNGGPSAVTRFLSGFNDQEDAISRRFGATPAKLPAEQIARYYATPQSRAALANSVLVRYLVESVRGWFS